MSQVLSGVGMAFCLSITESDGVVYLYHEVMEAIRLKAVVLLPAVRVDSSACMYSVLKDAK
jgi:hypothetical protein